MNTLSIVIPCYNEVADLEKVIDAVLKSPVGSKEVIVVDDGSTDGTSELIRNKLEQRVARVIFHEKNRARVQHFAAVSRRPAETSFSSRTQTSSMTLGIMTACSHRSRRARLTSSSVRVLSVVTPTGFSFSGTTSSTGD